MGQFKNCSGGLIPPIGGLKPPLQQNGPPPEEPRALTGVIRTEGILLHPQRAHVRFVELCVKSRG
jgi:hypothetical protein